MRILNHKCAHTHSSSHPTHTDLALRETQAMLRAGSEGPVRGLTWLRSWDCLAPKIAYSVLARELLLYPDKVQGGDALYVLLLVRTVHSSPLPPTPLPLCSLTPSLSHTLSLSHPPTPPPLYNSLALYLMPQTRLIESPVCAFSESDFQLDLKGVRVMNALLAKLQRPSGGVV